MSVWDRLAAINPVSLTEAIRQCLYVGLAFEILRWNDQQLAIVLSAISACLSLFARSSTISHARVEQRVDEKVAQREMTGTTGTGIGLAPPTSTGTGSRPRPIVPRDFDA